MSPGARHDVTFTPAARPHLNKLPADVAAAIYEHVVGPVADNPRRLGKAPDEPYADVRSARRGEYRVLYTIDEERHSITVLVVAHRRDAYRRR